MTVEEKLNEEKARLEKLLAKEEKIKANIKKCKAEIDALTVLSDANAHRAMMDKIAARGLTFDALLAELEKGGVAAVMEQASCA